MATTATLLMPYPALSAAANGPVAFQALADRIETLFTGRYGVPAIVRVKNPSAQTGFGSGTYTPMNWTVDYTIGPSGTYTFTTGTVTVVNAGIYLLAMNASFSSGVGTAGGEAQLHGLSGRVYCRASWPNANMLMSASTVEYLAAGSTVQAYVFNNAGVMTIDADNASGAPCAYTVTRLAGS